MTAMIAATAVIATVAGATDRLADRTAPIARPIAQG